MEAVFSGEKNKGQHVHVALGEVYVQKKFFTAMIVIGKMSSEMW